MTYLVSVILIAQSLLVLLILREWIEARKDRNEKQRIIEAQEETLRMRNERIKIQDEVIRKQQILIEERREHSVIISEQIQKRDEIIEAQKKLIEAKLTEKVKEAFEKPKRPRKNV